jgi:hypothetical protein
MVHLLGAIFWALVAAALFVWKAYWPYGRGLSLPYSNIFVGWLALALAGYNLVRWWSRRMIDRGRRMQDQQRERSTLARSVTDPQFQFDRPEEPEGAPPKA